VHELHGSVCTMTCVACKKKRSVWPEMTRLRQLDKKQVSHGIGVGLCMDSLASDWVWFSGARVTPSYACLASEVEVVEFRFCSK
jgi:NAD-dependent SIR2 family protein deacetylase